MMGATMPSWMAVLLIVAVVYFIFVNHGGLNG
jgi:hypothetical protein